MEKTDLAKSIEPVLEKIENLPKIQRLLISAVFFILVLAIFAYFFYYPKFEKIASLKTNLKTLEKKLSTAKVNAADIEKFQAKMREAEAQFNRAMKKLPDKEEIPSLLTAISDSGQTVGLKFLLFEPKKEKKKEFYAEIPVAMSLQGNYHNLALFFDKVARLNRIVNIENIQLSRGKGKGAKGLSAKCTAVTYKFIDQKKQPKKKKKKKKKRRK
jgi:type IV pilus assembly protein PilO